MTSLLHKESPVAWKKFAGTILQGLNPCRLVQLTPAARKSHRASPTTTRRIQREMLRFRLCIAKRPLETHEKFDRSQTGLQRTRARTTSQLWRIQSQKPVATSPQAEQTSQNVVQSGSVSPETFVKQAQVGFVRRAGIPDFACRPPSTITSPSPNHFPFNPQYLHREPFVLNELDGTIGDRPAFRTTFRRGAEIVTARAT